MSIFNQRNRFYFDHPTMRLEASAMDLRPFLKPTGWVLNVKGADEWEMAEYGVAYSPESATIHAEEAKGRYLRKRFYGGRYERELSLKERAELKQRIAREAWNVMTFPAVCAVNPSPERHKTRIRAAQLEWRDGERLEKLNRTRRVTVPRKSKQQKRGVFDV